jgi:hypothetical protein
MITLILTSLIALSSLSTVALVRAVRHAPEGRQTKLGFVFESQPTSEHPPAPEETAVPLRVRPAPGSSARRIVQTASVR